MSRIEDIKEVTEALQNAESLDSYTDGYLAYGYIVEEIIGKLSNAVYEMGELLDEDVTVLLKLMRRFEELVEQESWAHLDRVKAEKINRQP